LKKAKVLTCEENRIIAAAKKKVPMCMNISNNSNKRPIKTIFLIMIFGLMAASSMLISSTSAAGESKEMPDIGIIDSTSPEDEPLPPSDITAKKVRETEAKKIKEGDLLFIKGKKIIDDYLSTKGRSIDRNSKQYLLFLNDIWLDGYPELETSDKRDPVLWYVVTVLEIPADTTTQTKDVTEDVVKKAHESPAQLPSPPRQLRTTIVIAVIGLAVIVIIISLVLRRVRRKA
jgi:hypothetical protein